MWIRSRAAESASPRRGKRFWPSTGLGKLTKSKAPLLGGRRPRTCLSLLLLLRLGPRLSCPGLGERVREGVRVGVRGLREITHLNVLPVFDRVAVAVEFR